VNLYTSWVCPEIILSTLYQNLPGIKKKHCPNTRTSLVCSKVVEHGFLHSFKLTTFKEALANEDVNKWKLTMDEEYQSLIQNNT